MKCSSEGCTNLARRGGVCIKHGAKAKICSAEGCMNVAVKGGVCIRHGAKTKRCSTEGCTNQVLRGGVCKRHGANGSTAFGSEYEETTAILNLPNQSTSGTSHERSNSVPREVVICQEIVEV